MKTLILTIAVFLTTSFASFAQSNEISNAVISKQPFVIPFEKLENYLDLSDNQLDDVSGINTYFIATQEKIYKSPSESQEEQMQQAIYANLKLLKDVLTSDQYKKYLFLLNITNYHRIQAERGSAFDNIYLAESVK